MNEGDWRALDALKTGDLEIDGAPVGPGDRVLLRPRRGGDVMDSALDGRTAIVESVEQDLEGNFHCVVVLEDDPGGDLGMQRMPGHRFFFSPAEIEVIRSAADSARTAPVLVAGIGNIFLGDDAFGVEVAQRMAGRTLPGNVVVTDFGIRGYDLAYALMRPHARVILVDACPRGGEPGTLYVIEPDLDDLGESGNAGILDGHGMNPMNVLRLAQSMGGVASPIVIVGCEPATFGPDEGLMGLSEAVEASIDRAIELVESLIADVPEPADPVAGQTPN
jgi:hydrogenase maturation protease